MKGGRQQKGGGGGGQKRNKKQFYKQQFQQSKRSEGIKQGITGFIVTCDPNKEQRCVKEMFNVLNDWVEKLYPDLDVSAIIAKSKLQNSDSSKPEKETQEQVKQSGGIDREIQDEIASLRRNRIFFVFETGTQGVVFIRMLDDLRPYIDINKLAVAIVNHIAETKESMSRFACRFIPIDVMCKAKMDDFQLFAKQTLSKYFTLAPPEGGEVVIGEETKEVVVAPQQQISWSMEFRNNNNNNIKKKEVLDFIFKSVDGNRNPVDLKNSDLSVIVEVYRDLLMIGVVPGYKDKKKYNLQQLVKADASDKDSDGEGNPANRGPVIRLKDLILGKRNQQENATNQPEKEDILQNPDQNDLDINESEEEKVLPEEQSDSSEDEEVRLL